MPTTAILSPFDGYDIADLQFRVVDIGNDAVSQDLKTLALLPAIHLLISTIINYL